MGREMVFVSFCLLNCVCVLGCAAFFIAKHLFEWLKFACELGDAADAR